MGRNAVGTEERADAFADYLEAVQWCTRPVTLRPDPLPALFSTLHVCEERFSYAELRKAVFCRPSGKSFLDGDVPIEYLKTIVRDGGPAAYQLLDLFNLCWEKSCVP